MCHGELYLSSIFRRPMNFMVQYLTISYATVWVCDANKKEMKICASSKGSMPWCESGKQQEVANMHAHPKTEWDCTVVVENPHQQKSGFHNCPWNKSNVSLRCSRSSAYTDRNNGIKSLKE